VLSDVLASYNLRRFNKNIRYFLLHGIPFFAGLGIFSVLFNLYLLRLGFQEDVIGRLAGMLPLASGLLAFPVGLWSDRIGRKPFLVSGALIQGAAQLGLCFLVDPSLLLALSFLAGFAPAFLFVNHVPFLAENSRPENRGHAISMAFSMQLLTRMAVSLVGGSLPAFFGWMMSAGLDRPEPFRYALMVGAAFSLLSVIPILKVKERETLEPGAPADLSNAESRELETGDRSEGPPIGILAKFMGVSAFRGLAFGLSMPFFNVFFDDVLQASAATIGLIFFAGQLLGVPSSMAAPAMSGRYGPIRCIVPFRAAGAVALALFGGLSELGWACSVFLLIMAVDSLTTPMEMTFATHSVSQRYWGRIQSLRVAGFQVLAGGASMWAGEMIMRHGYGHTFVLSGAATLLSGLLLLAGFGWGHSEKDGRPVPIG